MNIHTHKFVLVVSIQDFLYIEVFNALELLCTAPPRCFNATKDIQNDYFCDIARMNLSIADPNLVCNGSCRALLDGLVNDCGNVSVEC